MNCRYINNKQEIKCTYQYKDFIQRQPNSKAYLSKCHAINGMYLKQNHFFGMCIHMVLCRCLLTLCNIFYSLVTDANANERVIDQLRKTLKEQESVMQDQDTYLKNKEEEIKLLGEGNFIMSNYFLFVHVLIFIV